MGKYKLGLDDYIEGITLSYWDCEYENYAEYYNEKTKEEERFYGCNHAEGMGCCDKDNEWGDNTAYCELAKLKRNLK